MHAKPFVGSLEGHRDGVYCMARDMSDLKMVASGSADGEVRVWNLASRKCVWSADAHPGSFVKGVGFIPNRSGQFLSCANDQVVKLWNVAESKPMSIFQGKAPFTYQQYMRCLFLFFVVDLMYIDMETCFLLVVLPLMFGM